MLFVITPADSFKSCILARVSSQGMQSSRCTTGQWHTLKDKCFWIKTDTKTRNRRGKTDCSGGGTSSVCSVSSSTSRKTQTWSKKWSPRSSRRWHRDRCGLRDPGVKRSEKFERGRRRWTWPRRRMMKSTRVSWRVPSASRRKLHIFSFSAEVQTRWVSPLCYLFLQNDDWLFDSQWHRSVIAYAVTGGGSAKRRRCARRFPFKCPK